MFQLLLVTVFWSKLYTWTGTARERVTVGFVIQNPNLRVLLVPILPLKLEQIILTGRLAILWPG